MTIQNTISKNIVATALLSLFLALTSFVVLGAQKVHAEDADVKNSVCQGANGLKLGKVDGGECNRINVSGNERSVNDVIAKIINIFSVIVGIIAVIMIIYGGLKYITSGGDSGRITSAKNTIIYAIIGLIIVALAQFVVRFILSQVNKTAN